MQGLKAKGDAPLGRGIPRGCTLIAGQLGIDGATSWKLYKGAFIRRVIEVTVLKMGISVRVDSNASKLVKHSRTTTDRTACSLAVFGGGCRKRTSGL